MIHVRATRNDGFSDILLSENDRSPRDACFSLLKYEFGFGGRPVSMSDTQLVVQTRIFSNLDTTCFSGSAEDMRVLVESTHAWASLAGSARSAMVEGLQSTKPFTVVHLLPVVIGTRFNNAILLHLSGVGEDDAAEFLERLLSVSFDDAFALAFLKRENPESSISEVLSCLG